MNRYEQSKSQHTKPEAAPPTNLGQPTRPFTLQTYNEAPFSSLSSNSPIDKLIKKNEQVARMGTGCLQMYNDVVDYPIPDTQMTIRLVFREDNGDLRLLKHMTYPEIMNHYTELENVLTQYYTNNQMVDNTKFRITVGGRPWTVTPHQTQGGWWRFDVYHVEEEGGGYRNENFRRMQQRYRP